MSIRPASPMAGTLQCAFRAASFTIVFSALSVFASSSALADGKETLIKTQTLYKNAKSFQGTVIVKSSGKGASGNFVVVTRTERIQYQSPNKFHIEASSTASGLSPKELQVLKQSDLKIYSDGKQMIVYNVATNKYGKRPVPPIFPLTNTSSVLVNLDKINLNSLKTLPNSATVQGRPAILIETLRPPIPKTGTPAEMKQLENYLKTMKQSPRFSIDKEKFSLLNIIQDIAGIALSIDLTSQVFNPTLPASSFTFVAPKGATEAQSNPASGPGQSLGGKPK